MFLAQLSCHNLNHDDTNGLPSQMWSHLRILAFIFVTVDETAQYQRESANIMPILGAVILGEDAIVLRLQRN